MRSTLEPEWKTSMTFQVPAHQAEGSMLVELLDHNDLQDDEPMGSTRIPLGEVPSSGSARRWVRLHGTVEGHEGPVESSAQVEMLFSRVATAAATAAVTAETTRQRIDALYSQHNPQKLAEVDSLVARFGEEELLVMIQEKYGAAPGPTEVPRRDDLAGGGGEIEEVSAAANTRDDALVVCVLQAKGLAAMDGPSPTNFMQVRVQIKV